MHDSEQKLLYSAGANFNRWNKRTKQEGTLTRTAKIPSPFFSLIMHKTPTFIEFHHREVSCIRKMWICIERLTSSVKRIHNCKRRYWHMKLIHYHKITYLFIFKHLGDICSLLEPKQIFCSPGLWIRGHKWSKWNDQLPVWAHQSPAKSAPATKEWNVRKSSKAGVIFFIQQYHWVLRDIFLY